MALRSIRLASLWRRFYPGLMSAGETGQEAAAPQRLIGVQYLRALAALMVLASHAVGPRFPVAQGLLSTGVDLFFLISGFVMVVATRHCDKPGRFVLRRLIRIVPLYWAATAIAVTIALVLPFFHYPLTAEYVAASFLFVPAESPFNGMVHPVIGMGWTLNYEMEFYALFTLSLFLVPACRTWVLCLALLGMTVLGFAYSPDSTALRFWLAPIVLEFAVGMAIASLWLSGASLKALSVVVPAVCVAIYSLFFMHWLPWLSLEQLRPIALAPMAPLFCAILWWEGTGTMPRSPLLLLLGEASYAIYLFQFFAILLATWLSHGWSAVPELFPAVVLAAGLVFGLAAHFLIDRPITAMLRRLVSPDRARSIPIGSV